MALLPLVHTLSIEPFDQRTSDVDQFPAPSVGVVGLAPLASQVNVSAPKAWLVARQSRRAGINRPSRHDDRHRSVMNAEVSKRDGRRVFFIVTKVCKSRR